MPELKPCVSCGRDFFPLRRGFCNRCDMRRRARHGYRCSYVDAAPVRNHVARLRAAGLGLKRIAEISGISRTALATMVNGRSERGTGPSRRVSERTASALLAVEVPMVAHRAAASHQLVDAIGTVRRAQALVALGYPRSYLAARLSISPANATRLFDLATLRVQARTARAVEALFTELQATPGPSQRARNDARRRGWEPPLAWDDDELDSFTVNLDAEPPIEESEDEVDFAELYEELRYLGYTDAEIARREGIEIDSLHRRLSRAGRSPAA